MNKLPANVQTMIDLLEDKQVEAIKTFDVRLKHPLTDFILVGTVNNTRKMQAIVDEVRRLAKGESVTLHHIEGQPESGWVLLDCHDMLIHLFSAEVRFKVEVERILEANLSR